MLTGKRCILRNRANIYVTESCRLATPPSSPLLLCLQGKQWRTFGVHSRVTARGEKEEEQARRGVTWGARKRGIMRTTKGEKGLEKLVHLAKGPRKGRGQEDGVGGGHNTAFKLNLKCHLPGRHTRWPLWSRRRCLAWRRDSEWFERRTARWIVI